LNIISQILHGKSIYLKNLTDMSCILRKVFSTFILNYCQFLNLKSIFKQKVNRNQETRYVFSFLIKLLFMQ